ncbi:MAG: VanW family protein [Candidatus Roizmanbacteria bacterium]|nr:VanW family protein [Candidatus Roizmanbacteria bacterium]
MTEKNVTGDTNKKENKWTHRYIIRFVVYSCLCIALSILGIFSVQASKTIRYYNDKIYPNITIGSVPVGSLTKEQALKKIAKVYKKKYSLSLTFVLNKQEVASISQKELAYSLPLTQAIDTAYAIARDENSILKYKTLLLLISSQEQFRIVIQPNYNNVAISENLQKINDSFKIDPINARFEFKDNKVTDFRKEEVGTSINENSALATIEDQLTSQEVMQGKKKKLIIQLQTHTIMPDITLSDINNLGISELIAEGKSQFHGSSAERVYNITLGSQRLNGIIIKPGETFSFVNALGEISGATGFKASYVIKSGKTVLGDGGGICQVSTTMFRTALYAGLPILERHAHTYRVGYYEQDSPPGFDATIYSPSVDLQFKNDYTKPILIQTSVDQTNLTLIIAFYGTKDSRIITVAQPTISNQIAAPPTEFIDDPSLGAGVVKQIEYSAPGASVSFDYSVLKNGIQTTKDTFNSNYTPWKAVFLRGT